MRQTGREKPRVRRVWIYRLVECSVPYYLGKTSLALAADVRQPTSVMKLYSAHAV